MNTNSINNKGCSVCEQGKENYTTFIAGAFRGTEYYQYDYRHTDGELFSTVAKSLEECRKRRDEWLSEKAEVTQTGGKTARYYSYEICKLF